MEIKEWFRYFFRKSYPEQIDLPNDVIDELGQNFDQYLRGKFDEEQINKWYPTSQLDLIMNSEHPFKHHGFELPLAYHFFDFIEIQAKKALADDQDIE